MNTIKPKNVGSLLEALITDLQDFENNISKIRKTGIPKHFGKEFLESLEIQTPNSVLFTKLFTAMGLVNENGIPSNDYRLFVESEKSARTLFAKKIKLCYRDAYRIDSNLHELSKADIRNVFGRIFNGQKSETFVRMIADTFKTLADYANWEEPEEELVLTNRTQDQQKEQESEKKSNAHIEFILELMNDSNHSYGNGHVSYDYKGNGYLEKGEKDNATDVDQVERKKQMNTSKLKPKDELIAKEVLSNFKAKNSLPHKKAESISETNANQKGLLSAVLERKVSLLHKLERYEEAVTTYDQMLKCYKDQQKDSAILSDTYLRKAELLEKLHDYQQAIGAYDDVIQLFATDKISANNSN